MEIRSRRRLLIVFEIKLSLDVRNHDSCTTNATLEGTELLLTLHESNDGYAPKTIRVIIPLEACNKLNIIAWGSADVPLHIISIHQGVTCSFSLITTHELALPGRFSNSIPQVSKSYLENDESSHTELCPARTMISSHNLKCYYRPPSISDC